ncbi:GNAT family N-acetyltransferase [Bacillus testis]|uniref:GNAT family N-acetyltransferase n=1 Tax=Bacillus testis TaxID=1622072 RepID=UPI00067EFD0A|nr:GNAT family N-acetyltransferase [Bacillus testis]
MNFEEIDSLEKLKSLRNEWNNILIKMNNDIPFLEFSWIEKWWEVFGFGFEMYVVALKDKSSYQAFLPLMKKRGFTKQTIYMIGQGQSNYMDIVVNPTMKNEALNKLVPYVIDRNRQAIFIWSGLLESSGTADVLQLLLENNGYDYSSTKTFSPYISFQEPDMPAFIKKRKKHHGVDRKEKRVKKLADISIRRIEEEHLDDMFSLHKKRWNLKWDTSYFSEEPGRTFFKKMAKLHGEALKPVSHGLFIEGRMIAFLFGFLCRGRYLFYLLGHDDDFGVFSPGKMIFNSSIAEHFNNGAFIYDMTIGDEPYKREWKTADDYAHLYLFAGKGTNSLSYLLLKWKFRINAVLKQYRPIILFKRNTLGKWRKLISDRKLFVKVGKKKLRMLSHKIFFTERCFIYKKRLPDVKNDGQGSVIFPVALKDLIKKKDFQGENLRTAVTKLFKGEKGYSFKEDHNFQKVSWTSTQEMRLGEEGLKVKLNPHTAVINELSTNGHIEGIEQSLSVENPELKEIYLVQHYRDSTVESFGYTLNRICRIRTIVGHTSIKNLINKNKTNRCIVEETRYDVNH